MNKWKAHAKLVFFYSYVVVLFLLGTILGNNAVSTISELMPIEQKHCIVIDAGHGGEDGGAVSCTGKMESRINLQIALRLEDLFHLLGYRTKMIRSTDTAIYTTGSTLSQKKASDLKHRVQIANENPDSILISIHQNTYPESQYHGAQVFYAKSDKSALLAKSMQGSINTALNSGITRTEKQGSGIYLLEKVTIPGILIECGFLSNPAEEAQLSTPEYQKKLCCVIGSSAAGFIHDIG